MVTKWILSLAVAVLMVGAPAQGCDHPDNLISNCGFDQDLSNWVSTIGDTFTHIPDDGSSNNGCAEIDAELLGNGSWFTLLRHQCFLAAPGTYGFGVDLRHVSGADPSCEVEVVSYTSDACSGSPTGNPTSFLMPSAVWMQSPQAELIAGAGTQSIDFTVFCESAVGDFTVRFDDAFLGVGLVAVQLESFEAD